MPISKSVGRAAACAAALLFCTAAAARGADFLAWPDDAKGAFETGEVDGRNVAAPAPNDAIAMSDDGAVALIDLGRRGVTIYPALGRDGSLDGAKWLPLDAAPTAVAYKRVAGAAAGYFLVGTSGGGNSGLRVIDAGTGEAVKAIAVGGQGVSSIAAPGSGGAAFAYYAAEQPAGSGRGIVGRIDLDRMADDGAVAMPEQWQYELAASEDGARLYARKPRSSPRGFLCLAVAPRPVGEGAARQWPTTVLTDEGESRPPYVIDPAGTAVACGKTLYAPDLSASLGDLPAAPAAFARGRPLIFAVSDDGNTLQVLSANTRRTLATESLVPPPAAVPAPAAGRRARPPVRRRPSPGGAAVACFVDEAHGAVVVADAQRAVRFKLDELHLPAEPTLAAEVRGGTELTAGRPWTATLETRDPATRVAVVGLGDAPPPTGLVCDDRTLRWTPGEEDLGTFRFALRLSAGDEARDVPLALTVRRASIELDVRASKLALSPDGNLALVVGTPPPPPGEPRRRGGDGGEESTPTVELIDLRRGATIARRTLGEPVAVAAVDGHFAYVVPERSSVLLALSLADLSDAKRVFTPSPVTRLSPVGPRLYAATAGSPSGWYSVPELTPDPESTAPADRLGVTPGWLPGPVHGEWFDDGVVYDCGFRAAQWVVQEPWLPRAVDAALPPSGGAFEAAPVGDWGVRVSGDYVQRIGTADGRALVNLGQNDGGGRDEGHAAVVPGDVPAVVVLTRQTSRDPGNTRRQAGLDVYDLLLGKRQATLRLSDEPRLAGGRDEPLLLTAGAGKLVAVVGQRLFEVPMASLPAAKLPRPLEVFPPDGAVVASATAPTTIVYAVSGGKAPVRFESGRQIEGLSLDASTGTLTLTPGPLLKAAVEPVFQAIQNRFAYAPGAGRRTPEESAAAYRRWAGGRYRAITGKAAVGYPVAVPVEVVAIDAEQQTARLLHTLLLDLPAPAVEAKLAEQRAAQEKQEAALRAATRPAAAAAGEVTALRQKVSELTLQNQLLQAKVDALSAVLAKGQPTTRP